MTTWRLLTHRTQRVPAAPDEVTAAAQLSRALQVEGYDNGVVTVRTHALVGVVGAGPLRVEIASGALSRAALLGMAAEYGRFALGAVVEASAVDEDLLSVVARSYCDALARLLSRGLVRAYHDRIDTSGVIRGEVVLERWFGPESPDGPRPVCRSRERTLDQPEHRLLAWAAAWIAGSDLVPSPLRRRAATLLARLGGPLDPPSRATLAQIRRTGLFSAYVPSLELAVVLWLGVTGGDPGSARSPGFLLDADRLYERWVLELVRASLPEGWAALGGFEWSLADRSLRRTMDTVVRDPNGKSRVILDAKNKDLVGREPPRDDVHQLLSYMATSGCPRGVLVAVSRTDETEVRRWTLRGGVGEMAVVTLPGGGDLATLRGAGTAWWRGELARARPEVAALRP